MLLTQKASIEAVRSLAYLVAESMDLAAEHPDAATREARRELVELLTPVTKAWGTDLGVELTSLALQVHGGAGYIEETGAAQYLRDARIAPIYEGTNGIQAVDLVTRKLTIRGGAAMSDLLDTIESLDQQLVAAGADLAPIRSQLTAGATAVRQATAWIMAAEPADALAGATPYLRLVGVVLGGWLMARQALSATSRLATARPSEPCSRRSSSLPASTARSCCPRPPGWSLPSRPAHPTSSGCAPTSSELQRRLRCPPPRPSSIPPTRPSSAPTPSWG
jgi:hypothetical protein